MGKIFTISQSTTLRQQHASVVFVHSLSTARGSQVSDFQATFRPDLVRYLLSHRLEGEGLKFEAVTEKISGDFRADSLATVPHAALEG
ncbi:hypothetical protein PoB_006910300 [Plakobranchus ocellatus]|uniref:Uncharacterized protein n=1 Tax=Plakobranchus ocellatus TaxID=259542 RepID=A0AAV4DEE2_9GAST|nr:hypothetical protein PoB_006910300 [Plakobranchus ocellatus]